MRNKHLPSVTLGNSPARSSNKVTRRRSMETHGIANKEFELAINSSRGADHSNIGYNNEAGDNDSDNGVQSVVAFVKENKEIWQ